MKCKICFSISKKLFEAKILNQYDVQYFVCPNCGFIQTESPYWLDEAYSQAITKTDIGLVGRNIMLAKITQAVIGRFFNSDGCFIDYGGGYGMLVRLMRDVGFYFYLYDKFAPNLFAENFDFLVKDSHCEYELATAFEVFEHLVDPFREIEQIFQFSRNVFFTTALAPETVQGK